MLYFFYGTDTDKVRARARGVIAAMKKKRSDAEYFRITTESWSPASFEEFISGQGLFERKFIVFADGVLENTEAKEWVTSRLTEIKESENAFIFLERKIDAASLKKIEKAAQEAKKFDVASSGISQWGSKEFHVFSLADALGERDRKRLWVLLAESFMHGETPEAISGVLFWQVKSMLAAQNAHSASESGLKPFVYMKSKRYALAYTPEELQKLSREILSLYHDSHRGIHDFETGLERFALSI